MSAPSIAMAHGHGPSGAGHGDFCGPALGKKKFTTTASAAIDQTSHINVASRLAALPGEIVSNIAGRLGSDDFFCLRLTCRDLEAKSLHTFAVEYFSCKGFIFTTDSLKVLLHIAESQRLRKYLHCIQFITAFFPDGHIECSNGCSCYGGPTVRQKEAYKDYMADQKQLKSTGDDKRLLAKSFQLLPKLNAIDVVDNFMMIDKNVDIRGFNKVQRVTGYPPAVPNEGNIDVQYQTWLSHIWETVIIAIALKPVPNLEEFRMLGRTAINGLSVDDLTCTTRVIEEVRPSFQGLKRLQLCMRSHSKSTVSNQLDMLKFGGLFSNLEDLRLSFDYFRSSELPDVNFLQDTNLSKLSKLHIDGLHTSAESLCSLLARMTCATEVFFMWVNIKEGTWVEVLEVLQHLSCLEHLHLQWLGQGAHKAYFLKQIEVPHRNFDDEWEDHVHTREPSDEQDRQPSTATGRVNNARTGGESPDQALEGSDADDDSGSGRNDNDEINLEGDGISTHEEHVNDVDHEANESNNEAHHHDYLSHVHGADRSHNVAIDNDHPQQTEQNFQAPGNEGYSERDLANTTAEDFLAAAMGPPPPAPQAAAQAGNVAAGGNPDAAALENIMINSFAQILGARGAPLPPFPFAPGNGGMPGRDG
nr:hypothetical protein CFP56_48701 [Quercus suber]